MDEIVLLGGGGHAKVVIDSLQSEGRKVVGIRDVSKNGYYQDIPFIEEQTLLRMASAKLLITIGNNETRKQLAKVATHSFTKTIHASALVAPSASIGVGCMLLHGVIIQSSVLVGSHVIANTACRIDHDCHIDDFVHIAPGAVLCGNVSIGEGTLVGAGAVVIPGVKIGKWVIVGAGTVVTKDIPDYAVVVGNPARIIKLVTKNE